MKFVKYVLPFFIAFSLSQMMVPQNVFANSRKSIESIVEPAFCSSYENSIGNVMPEVLLETNAGTRVVNLKCDFVPPYIRDSEHAGNYFISGLSPDKMEKLGLLYDFDYSKLFFYVANDNPASGISEVLDGNGNVKKRILENENLISDIRQKLAFEGFYAGNDSLNSAVIKYQNHHHLQADGVIGEKTASHMAKDYDELADIEFEKFKRFFTSRMYYSTGIINPVTLEDRVNNTLFQLNMYDSYSLAETLESIGNEPPVAKVEIPSNYLADSMDLSVEITKRKDNKSRGTLRLYQHLNNETILLLETDRIVMGGVNKDDSKNNYRMFPTPSGNFYMNSGRVLPRWIPPSWDNNPPKSAKEPGVKNAFGLFAFDVQGTNAIRLHSTYNTSAFDDESKSSHGCTRIDPRVAMRFFDFLIRYTPGSEMNYIWHKGSVINFDRIIPVSIR